MHKSFTIIMATFMVAQPSLAQEMDHNQHMQHMEHQEVPMTEPIDDPTPAVHGADVAPIDWETNDAMRKARAAMAAGAGGMIHHMILADRLEYRAAGSDQLIWDAQGWVGGDLNRVWFKSEGEMDLEDDAVEGGTFELFYGRAISPFFDVLLGVGQGLQSGPSPTYASIGLQGLAPQWFEVDGALRLDTDGNVTASFEAEYDLLITQRLVLQPRAELALSMQDMPEYDLGSGFTGLEAGLRLRYEINRQFAPYIGVSWHRKLGSSADIARAGGHGAGSVGVVLGLRSWF